MLVIAVSLVTVANRLVEGLITPLFEKFKLDKFYLMYVAWAVGSLLVGLSKVNLFVDVLPDPTTGLVLTAIVAGGGANLLHDLFDLVTAFKGALKQWTSQK